MPTSLALASGVNELALSVFAVFIAVTLGVTYWAAKRTRTASDFWAAGRGISARQNGFAIAGDYMSASSFLGVAGLMYFFGFDGFIVAISALVGFLPLLLLLAERMRNAGKFTVGDVLAFRLAERPTRAAASLATLSVASINLLAQMVAAGLLFHALAGISFSLSVLLTGGFMLVYVLFGGMLATTWVQIIKASLLLAIGGVLAILVLSRNGFDPIAVFNLAAAKSGQGQSYLGPGLFLDNPVDMLSIALAFLVGTAGYPHILIRFFTVPDGKAARGSVGWAVLVIGAFYVLLSLIGYGSRAVLGAGGVDVVGGGGNLAAPALAQTLGGGAGSFGGELFLAIVSAVAFATILAVVAGLVIAASGAAAHDIWTNLVRKGRIDQEHEEPRVARIVAVTITVVAVSTAILVGDGFNITFLVALAISVAASANFPALLLSLTWRRLTTAGAVTGVAFGLLSSIALIVMSPPVWPGPDSHGSPFPLAYPALVSIPLGFIGCWLGTVLSRRAAGETDDRFDELKVRSETGLMAVSAMPGDTTPDWGAIARSQPFRALTAARRRFVVPVTIASVGWFLAFILLCGLARDFMAESIYQGLTVAYVLGLSQIVMVWAVSWFYLRASNRKFDPLAREALLEPLIAAPVPSSEPAAAIDAVI